MTTATIPCDAQSSRLKQGGMEMSTFTRQHKGHLNLHGHFAQGQQCQTRVDADCGGQSDLRSLADYLCHRLTIQSCSTYEQQTAHSC